MSISKHIVCTWLPLMPAASLYKYHIWSKLCLQQASYACSRLDYPSDWQVSTHNHTQLAGIHPTYARACAHFSHKRGQAPSLTLGFASLTPPVSAGFRTYVRKILPRITQGSALQ